MRFRRRVGWSLLALMFASVVAVGFGFWHSGYRAYVIHTGSMESTLMPGDLIIDRPVTGELQPGEIITFRHSAGPDLVTHRITDITAAGIHTKGDANRSADVWDIPPAFVQGSVHWQLPGFGYAVTFLKQPTGLAAIIAALVGLILLWGLFFPPTPTEATPSEATPSETTPTAVSGAPEDERTPANPWTEPPPRETPNHHHPGEFASNADVIRC